MKKKNLNPPALAGISRIFKALCEPIRLQILQELQDSEKSVSELCEAIGTSQPNLSKHLKTLTDAHFLQRRQEGNSVYYSIADPMVYELCEIVCRRLEKKLSEQIQAYATTTHRPKRARLQ